APVVGAPPAPPGGVRAAAPATARPEALAIRPEPPPAARPEAPAATRSEPPPVRPEAPATRPEPPPVRPQPPPPERRPALRAPIESIVLPGAAAGPASASVPPAGAPGAEVIELSRRVRRWRTATMLTGALAACLLALVVVREANPDLLPTALRPKEKVLVQTVEVPSARPSEFVAVFQKDDASPAFLLTFDLDKRSLTVRRVGAEQQAGKSYE